MKPAVRITRLKDQARDDLRYWLSRSVAERLTAVEQLRRDHEGVTADVEPRLQEFVASFNAHAVEYLVVGGYALAQSFVRPAEAAAR